MQNTRVISKFINGRLSSEDDRKIRRFVGQHHRSHCIAIFGNNHKKVHSKVDALAKKVLGKKHRLYGHSIDFIKKNFKNEEESAAIVHLLGDFLADILPEVFNDVYKNLKKNNVDPPSYLSFNKTKDSWDVKETAIKNLTDKIGDIIFMTLKRKKNRKFKRR